MATHRAVLELAADARVVLAADGYELLDLVHLFARLHRQQWHREKDVRERGQRVRQLVLAHRLVRLDEALFQGGELEGGGGVRRGRRRGLLAPRRVDAVRYGRHAWQAARVRERGGVHCEHVGLEGLESAKAELEVQHAERGVEGARGGVLHGQLAALQPALRDGLARRRRDERP